MIITIESNAENKSNKNLKFMQVKLKWNWGVESQSIPWPITNEWNQSLSLQFYFTVSNKKNPNTQSSVKNTQEANAKYSRSSESWLDWRFEER